MSATSNQRNTWKRLKKNRGAMIGLFIIVISCFIAVFAYFISPDNSPNANRMIVEIGDVNQDMNKNF